MIIPIFTNSAGCNLKDPIWNQLVTSEFSDPPANQKVTTKISGQKIAANIRKFFKVRYGIAITHNIAIIPAIPMINVFINKLEGSPFTPL